MQNCVWVCDTTQYIGNDRCIYQNVSNAGDHKCVNVINLPQWVDNCSL